MIAAAKAEFKEYAKSGIGELQKTKRIITILNHIFYGEGGKGRLKKALVIAFFVSVLLMQVFIGLEAVAVDAYSVKIDRVVPEDGSYLSLLTYPELPWFNITVYVKYSLPASSAYAGSFEIRLNVYEWDAWYGNGWQSLPYGQQLFLPNEDWNKGEIALKTTAKLNKTKLEVFLSGSYAPIDSPQDGAHIDLNHTIIITYTSEPLLFASFIMDPENPTVTDTITFTSTSITKGSSSHPIGKYKWYLDGEDVWYLDGDIGGLEGWATWKSPSFSWSKPTAGFHTVNLTITDNQNTTTTTSKTFEVKTTQGLSVSSSAGGLVADGVSSAKIGVELPTTQSKRVKLSDGVTELTQDAVDGKAIFTYVPDTEKLGLLPLNIPKEGASITLTASLDDGTSGSITLKVYRRPILLVHGLWSSGAMWSKMVKMLENDGFTVYTMDYPNVGSLKTAATEYLAPKIEAIKKDFSQPLYYHSLFKTNYLTRNVTKIDVIAHSAGGVVTRYYINDFVTDDFKAGGEGHGIKTLITVGTPHLGSPWPKEYQYWVQQRSILPVIQPILHCTQVFLSEGAMGKEGQALIDLMPDSLFLNEVNDPQWHNPTVDYYAICGTDNYLSTAYGMALYERNFIDWMTCQKMLMTGDGVVESTSQRFAERIQKGYYVNEWHCSEGSSHQVFEISSKILKGLEQEIPSIYRSPAKESVSANDFTCTKDAQGDRFRWVYRSMTAEGSQAPLVEVKDGDVLENGATIYAWFNREKASINEKATFNLQVKESNSQSFTGIVYVCVQSIKKQPGLGGWIGITVLSPTSFKLFHASEADIYIRSEGPLNIITEDGTAASPDPELAITIDEGGSLKMVVLEGNMTVFDNYNGSAFINEGQAATFHPDIAMETSNVDLDSIDKWWINNESTGDQPWWDPIIGFLKNQYKLIVAAAVAIILIIIIAVATKKRKTHRPITFIPPSPP